MKLFSAKKLLFSSIVLGALFFSNFEKSSNNYGTLSSKVENKENMKLKTDNAAITATTKLAVLAAVELTEALLGSLDSKNQIEVNNNMKLSNLD